MSDETTGWPLGSPLGVVYKSKPATTTEPSEIAKRAADNFLSTRPYIDRDCWLGLTLIIEAALIEYGESVRCAHETAANS